MKKIDFVSLEIKVENQTVLVILLHNDGTINRKGDGSQKLDSPFVIGMGDTKEIFNKLSPLISKDFEGYLNQTWDDPERKGKTCSIEIKVVIDSQAAGCKVTYGIDSMSPPSPISNFVAKTIELTNIWYAKGNKNEGVRSKKPWWQFWK